MGSIISNYRLGILTEYFVCLMLIVSGHKILKVRFKTKQGEIDIIAKKKRAIIFVEVKRRKNSSAFFDAITNKQKQRIMRSAEIFIKRHLKYQKHQQRFDIFFVKNPFNFRHIKNALYN